ncbi:MAG: hypothetical protein M3Y57_10330 [Acidobacteriota bacterium]|nr:hypothetical protein [Acidobacteriota bacterium]
MSAASIASEPLDRSSLQAIMIRWELAQQYLTETARSEELGKMALHVIVSHDIPVLLRELTRLRPEFSVSNETNPPQML